MITKEKILKVLPVVLLFAVSAGALFFRISEHSFWTDEWYTFKYFDLSFLEFIKEYWQNPDNHPPGYYLILLAFVKLFGRHDIVVRLPSILAGFGALIMTYRIALLMSAHDNDHSSYLAVLLAAFSPYLIILSQTARYFSLSAFLALAATYAVIKMAQEGGRRFFIYYALAFVAIGYVDYPTAIYVGAGSVLFLLWHSIRTREFRLLRNWIVTMIPVAFALLPLLSIAVPEARAEAAYGSDVLTQGFLAWLFRVGIYGYAALYGFVSFPWDYEITVPLILIAAFLVFAAIKDRGMREVFWKRPAIMAVIVMGLSGFIFNTALLSFLPRYTPLAYPRYVSFALYLWFILFAGLLWWLTEKRRGVRLITIVLLVFVSFWPLFDKFGNTSADPTLFAFNHSVLYGEIKRQSNLGDSIMINDDFPKVIFDWYHGRYFQQVTPLETPLDATFFEQGNRLWVIGFGYDDRDDYREPRQKAEDVAAPLGDAVRVMDVSSIPGISEKLRAFKKRLTGHDTYKEKVGLFLVVSKTYAK